MNDETLPFLGDKLPAAKSGIILIPFLIFLFSTIRFFSGSFAKILILSSSTFKYILPLILNIFTENEVPNLLINPILIVILYSIMLRKWSFQKIAIYSSISAVVSNFITFILFLILSIIPSFQYFTVCGSLSLNISLAVSICYAYKPERISIFGKVYLKPADIFSIVCLWAFCCFRWPPVSLLSALVSFFVSFMILTNLHTSLQLPKSEIDFNINVFLPFQKEEEQKPQSILDTLNLTTSSQELSEADQSRRMRALRAIEERLETLQNTK